jgi:branched-chain amino acid transport system ATP-binding protein
VHYGGIQAVRDVSFTLREGEQATLIGANGAGKAPPCAPLPGWKALAAALTFNGKAVRKHSRRPCCVTGW